MVEILLVAQGEKGWKKLSDRTQNETWLKCELYYAGGCAVQTKSACDACKEKVWMNHPDYQKKFE